MIHVETPVWEAPAGYSATDRPLLFKMDALQPSGSFKLRGVGLKCERAAAAGATAFVCASGGNAGLAAAYAAVRLGLPITIVVPETTSDEARAAILRLGADLQVVGRSFDEANAHANALADDRGATYVHPFDDPILWEGHASLVDELVARGHAFDCILVSVGGGGLLAGIAEGLARNGLAHIPLVAVETYGADCLAESLAAGHKVTLPAITSIATSLGAKTLADRAYALATGDRLLSVRVTDAQAVAAAAKFADHMRVLVEPACGAALAALDVHADLLARFEKPLVEVCGGAGVSLARLEAWRKQFGV